MTEKVSMDAAGLLAALKELTEAVGAGSYEVSCITMSGWSLLLWLLSHFENRMADIYRKL